MGLEKIVIKSSKKVLTPKNPNDYYKAGLEEIKNPKYFCNSCGEPVYNELTLGILRDQNRIKGGYPLPKRGYYVCNNRGCGLYQQQFAALMFENQLKIDKILRILEKLNEEE